MSQKKVQSQLRRRAWAGTALFSMTHLAAFGLGKKIMQFVLLLVIQNTHKSTAYNLLRTNQIAFTEKQIEVGLKNLTFSFLNKPNRVTIRSIRLVETIRTNSRTIWLCREIAIIMKIFWLTIFTCHRRPANSLSNEITVGRILYMTRFNFFSTNTTGEAIRIG